MLTLVVGGAASGKSAYAEALLLRSAAVRRIYLAAMEPFGPEAEARIKRHRAMRSEKGFETLECYVNIKCAPVPSGASVLLEDLGNLCANELFSPQGAGKGAIDSILRGIDVLYRRCRDLIIVSNEVFTGGADYGPETMRYLSLLSYVNRKIAARADAVCEICGGVAMYYKGAEI